LHHNDFHGRADCWRWGPGFKGTETAQKWAGIPQIGNRAPSTRFLSHDLKRLSARDPSSHRPNSTATRYDEVLVCMALPFYLAGASTSIITGC
jgi:hypothetical protein